MAKATLRVFVFVALCLTVCTVAIRAQSALDGFDPNANNSVEAIVVQTNGKVLIGGGFTTVLGAPRNYIARLNVDGTLDTLFNPNSNGAVVSIVVQADGKILVGGTFHGANSIGGQARNYIARLDPTTGAADTFDPNSNNTIVPIVVQPDGKILVGGYFTSIGGQMRSRMARLNPSTGMADSLDPNAHSSDNETFTNIYVIAVQRDGKILAGGSFNSIGGQSRNYMARLDPVTGLADSFNPNASGGLLALAVQPDGKILAGGIFGNIGGQMRGNMARLDPVTGLADSLNPHPNNAVTALAVQPDGKILVGGVFAGVNSIGGQSRYRIARLDPITGLADSFDPAAYRPFSMQADPVHSLAVQKDGKVLANGDFTVIAPNGGPEVTRNHIARLETDGRVDQTLNLSAIGNAIEATAVQPDGKMLIGGNFTSVLGVARNNIARLNTDGTLDAAFNPNANGDVLSLAVQPDGKILTSGSFSSIGGATRSRIARLDAVNGAADSFDPNANDSVTSIAAQTDGKILAGGNFTAIGGQSRGHMARLDPMTGLADSFDPNADGMVNSIAVQADGKILTSGAFTHIGGAKRNFIARLDGVSGSADAFDSNADGVVATLAVQSDGKITVGGEFSNVGGQARSRMARLDAISGAADSFNPNANGAVVSILMQADGKILAGGNFTSIGGQTRNYIARLDGASGQADSFDANANSSVLSLALPSDGKILAGGQFTNIGGQPRNLFARLTNDTAAQQNLIVTSSTIIWTRGGSSAQLTRATFESSTDNVNYSPLGNGTAAGSNWTLSGLSLPTSQHIYIRARGYYRTGANNASESIAESVRDAFITLPPTPTQVVSRKGHNGTPRDIALPLTGNPGIECRSGGASNDYEVVFTFSNSVTFSGAAVVAAAGTVSGSSGNGTSSITVNLTGATNAQRIMVTLQGASDGTSTGDLIVPMGVLIGDTNGDGAVNNSDVSQTKAESGQSTTAANFREDANADGSISNSDISLVKSKSGTSLP